MYITYLVVSLPVSYTYINDALIMSFHINTSWLYHYMAVLNILNFLDHYSTHLYLWRDRGRKQGRWDAELQHLQEKLKMANELHDMVGSELSQLVAFSDRESKFENSVLNQLAVSALDKVRTFAHILKGEEKIDSLPEILGKLYYRLKSLERYEIVLIENEQLYIKQNINSKKNKNKFNKDLTNFEKIQVDRILSEWIANVIRHGKPNKIIIGYREAIHKLTIFIWDDNVQFKWNGKAQSGGLGSISWRAKNISASICARSYNKGTFFVLQIKVPVRKLEK